MSDTSMSRLRKARGFLITVVMIFSFCGLAACGQSSAPSGSSAAYVHLEPGDAKDMIESGECILVDTRGEPQYDYEHIPGAINVPVDADDSFVTEALPDKSAEILLYCDYGGLSKQMGDRLAADLGYTNIYEFDGLLVWDGELEGTAGE